MTTTSDSLRAGLWNDNPGLVQLLGLCPLLAVTGTFQQLLTYTVFTGWIFYALGAASLFVYRRRQPSAPRPFRVPGYPLTPLLFVGAAAAIVLNTLVTQPRQGLIGVGVVFVGAPAYFMWSRRAGSKGPEKTGTDHASV